MIQSEEFLAALHRHGFDLVSGVPCSYLTPLINGTIESSASHYVNAANEGEAVAIAAGASLGGVGGVAMFQNSGLGNAVSPLTSLTWVFRIPILVITTWRGQPGGPPDEPQHALMGRITMDQLKLMEIPAEPFPTESQQIGKVLTRARHSMDASRRPYALVMQKGSVAPQALGRTGDVAGPRGQLGPPVSGDGAADVDEALRAVQDSVGETDVVLATTGFTGRALYACGDRDSQLYMVGSMGCVSSLGLGLALAQPERRIVVLDGDGALLMRMGALAAIGRERPANLLHIVFDNGVHDSTGGQNTLAQVVDFPAVAVGCGYPHARTLGSVRDLSEAIRDDSPGLRMLHLRTRPRTDRQLPRPKYTPESVARRLERFLELPPCPPTANESAC